MDMNEDYQENLEAKLNHLWAKIKELTVRAEGAEGEEKIKYVEGRATLKAKQEEVKKKLKELN
jgi:hypothetical protein